MPIVEALVLKGLFVAGKFLLSKAVIGKTAIIATKAIGTKILAAYSIAQIASAVMLVGLVVGGVAWTKERVENLKNGVQALSDGEYLKAIRNFGELALSANLSVEMLPDAVNDALLKINVSPEKASNVANWIRNNENGIVNYIKNR